MTCLKLFFCIFDFSEHLSGLIEVENAGLQFSSLHICSSLDNIVGPSHTISLKKSYRVRVTSAGRSSYLVYIESICLNF